MSVHCLAFWCPPFVQTGGKHQPLTCSLCSTAPNNLNCPFKIPKRVVHLTSGGLNSPADVDAEVSSDGSGLGVGGVGLTQHHPACLHHTLAFPHLENSTGTREACEQQQLKSSEPAVSLWVLLSTTAGLRLHDSSPGFKSFCFDRRTHTPQRLICCVLSLLTMATTGPELMYSMRPVKNGLPFRSA